MIWTQWMEKYSGRKIVSLALLAICSVVAVALQFSAVQDYVRNVLAEHLILKGDLVQHCGVKGADSKGAIYVLGGSRESLERKFVTAARLYHDRVGGKILLLREPGIMDYSPAMKRNQSYDEWVTAELKKFGVRTEDIEAVSISVEYFGTLSEAKSIPGIVTGQGYSRLALVTSSYHARRTWESFVRYAEESGLDLCIYSSDEDVYFYDVFLELLKLMVYEMFLV